MVVLFRVCVLISLSLALSLYIQESKRVKSSWLFLYIPYTILKIWSVCYSPHMNYSYLCNFSTKIPYIYIKAWWRYHHHKIVLVDITTTYIKVEERVRQFTLKRTEWQAPRFGTTGFAQQNSGTWPFRSSSGVPVHNNCIYTHREQGGTFFIPTETETDKSPTPRRRHIARLLCLPLAERCCGAFHCLSRVVEKE